MICCTCTDWAPGAEVLNGALGMWYNHGAVGGPLFVPFRYCPWCGKRLAPDVERRVADHPEQVPMAGDRRVAGRDGDEDRLIAERMACAVGLLVPREGK